MPLPNRAQRTRVGNIELLIQQGSRAIQQTNLRLQNGDLNVENRALRTVTDLEQLSRQLRRASRDQNIDAQLSQNLAHSADEVQQLAISINRRTERLNHRGQLDIVEPGFSCGTLRNSSVGRPRVNILRSQLEFLLSLGFTPTSMARNQIFGPNVHRNTIQNRMREWNLSCNQYATITDAELDGLVETLNHEYPNSGYREMTQLLRERYQVHVPRYRAMESLRRVDPAGAAGRWACVVSRRTYTATSANSCWHLDTNHSLIGWKIVVHGCIDGLSRLVPYLGASDNNKAKTNLMFFLLGVKSFGLPSRVRGDRGGENVHIEQFMNEVCGLARGSFLRGRSVHNSRVERLWRDVFAKVLAKYYNLFRALEDNLFLDPENDDHLFILHYIYIPRINRDLQEWANVHNSAPLSSCSNNSPLRLWVSDLIRQQDSPGTAIENFWNRDIGAENISILEEFGIDNWDLTDPEGHEHHVLVKQLEVSFSEEQGNWMTRNIDIFAEDAGKPHGLKQYELLYTRLLRINALNDP